MEAVLQDDQRGMNIVVLNALAIRRRWARECSIAGMPCWRDWQSTQLMLHDIQTGRLIEIGATSRPELKYYIPDPPLPLP